jgi:4-hydroxy-3-methylbut-2-enyl diphosphate reductase
MTVVVPVNSGFCPGVKTAVKNLFEASARHDGVIHVYGNLINNARYIRYLGTKNVVTVQNREDIPDTELVAIRTHGIDRNEEEELRRWCDVLDLTCVNVKKVQLKIQDYSKRGYFVVITGKKKHPEIIGLKSYASHCEVLESWDDLSRLEADLKDKLSELACNKVLLVSQTTGNREFFVSVIERIKTLLDGGFLVEHYDSICPVTNRKEKDALLLQKGCDISFVVGDKDSSNAYKLFETLKKQNAQTFFVEDLEALKALNLPLDHDATALVVSSASTPKQLEDEIVEYLGGV